MLLHSYNRRMARWHYHRTIQHHIWMLTNLRTRHYAYHGYYIFLPNNAKHVQQRRIPSFVAHSYRHGNRRNQGKRVSNGSRPTRARRKGNGTEILLLVLLVYSGWSTVCLYHSGVRPANKIFFLRLSDNCRINGLSNYFSHYWEKLLHCPPPTWQLFSRHISYHWWRFEGKTVPQEISRFGSLAWWC